MASNVTVPKMMRAVVFSALLLSTQSSVNNLTKVPAFVKDVIDSTFPSFRYLLYISDSCEISEFVNTALMQLNVQLTQVSLNNINNCAEDTDGTSGYIVVASDINTIIASLFSSTTFRFRPHIPLLIFYQSQENLLREPFLQAVNLKGIQIIAVQCKVQNFQNGFKIGNFSAVFLQYNITLLAWDGINDYSINPKTFQMNFWKPNFTYDGVQRSFRVSTFNCSPYVIYSPDKGVYDGVEYYYIKFTTKGWPVEYIIPNDSKYGYQWPAAVDDVVNGRSDLAACSLWTSALMEHNVSMNYPYLTVCNTFLVSRPRLVAFASYVLQAVEPKIWLLVLFVVIIVAVCLVLAAKIKTISLQISDKYNSASKYTNFIFALLQTIRICSISCLEVYPPPSYSALRLILTTWSATCLLLSTGFSSGYASSLSSPRYSAPIKTMKDMINRGIKIDKWEPILSMFKTSYNQDMRQLANNFVQNMTDKDEVIRSGIYATFVKTALGGYVTNTEQLSEVQRADVTLLSECYENNYIHFALTKHSPFIKIFDTYYRRITSAGLHQYLAKSVITPDEAKYMSSFFSSYISYNPYSPLRFAKVQGVLYFLISGYAIAMVAFLGEILYYRINK